MRRIRVDIGRGVVLCAAATLVAATACGQSGQTGQGGTSSAQANPGARVVTRTVQIDGKTDVFHGSFMAYFPKSVMAHPGDTIAFHDNDNGEPHSVTAGTLVEKGLAAADKAGPNAPPPPEFASLPVMLPIGPGDANQAASQPCYLLADTPPTDPAKACPQLKQPDFDGTQTYYSSGAIRPDTTWSMHLSPTIKPGTYRYYCDLHGTDMTGQIVVVAAAQPVPGQAQIDTQARTELQGLIDKLMPDYQAAKAGHAKIPGNLAGLINETVENAMISEFFPQTVQAKVGQPVTWTVLAGHTITVGGPDPAPPVLLYAPDGVVHLRPELVSPMGGPGAPPPPTNAPPPTGPQPTIAINGGSYDGTGEHSSGFIPSFPPQTFTYSLTFTKPGTYTVDCLIHPHMEAKVVVTQ